MDKNRLETAANEMCMDIWLVVAGMVIASSNFSGYGIFILVVAVFIILLKAYAVYHYTIKVKA